jgi:hypothetical protein
MSFLEDLAAQRTAVAQRIAQRGIGGLDRLETLAQDEDNQRLQLLAALLGAAQDPGYQGAIDQAADAQFQSAVDGIRRNAGIGEGRIVAGAAQAGTLGGSRQLAARGRLSAETADATTGAARTVEDFKRAQGDAREDGMRAMLDRITSPTQAGAQQTNTLLTGLRDVNRLNDQAGRDLAPFRNTLANALAGFVQNGISPTIQAGFDRADRLNQREFRTWEAGDRVKPPPAMTNRWTLGGD